ncbi:hypothetical protein OG21DRAFT_1507231 [Imleria badia]|nr:hypothetical protein OG21DRAFT_1507231 [Imleria badia]
MSTSTSLEISHAVGGNVSVTESKSFNDYNTATKGDQRIVKVTLYKSGNEVVGIQTTYAPGGEIKHGKVSGAGITPTEVPVGNDQYIIAAFIATLDANQKIASVFFNIAKATGEVVKVGLDVVPQSTVHPAFGRIIAFHGTTRGEDETLESLGVQVLQTR